MFDIFAKTLSSIASFLFPLFASYKALKTSDPGQLTPWLMYWVVLACVLLVESWTDWFLVWIPFYAYFRLLFLLYLVLPQTQGARIIYQTYIHPWLQENESAIEDLIASSHERLRATGMAYVKRAIEYFRTNVLGLSPSPESASAAAAQPQTSQSYTQSLLARFNLPSAGWPANASAGTGAGAAGTDFYNFLASAVNAATGAAGSAGGARGVPGGSDMSSSTSTLIPDTIRGAAARMTYLHAQRERLNSVLSALDREATQIQSEAVEGMSTRSMSQGSGLSGLAKSRSEADFEKLEAESGAEEEMEDGATIRRRGGSPSAAAGGSWMPWGWGSTPTGDSARSSGIEKNQ